MTSSIGRRELITLLGTAASAATWPLAARAQQGERVRHVAFLSPGDESTISITTYYPLFTQGLAELGWVNGRNLRIELRMAGGSDERIQMLAREVAELRPDVIVVTSGPATKAVQAQTSTVPIVFVYAGDPVANGIVTNIARPEGNTTGVTDLFPSIGGKWLELLKEVKPDLARVALLFNPDFLNEATMAAIEAAAAKLGVQAVRITVRNSADMASAVDEFAIEPNGGIIPVPPIGALPGALELMHGAA